MKRFITFVGEHYNPGIGGAYDFHGSFEDKEAAIQALKEHLADDVDAFPGFWGHVFDIESEKVVWKNDV